MTSIDRSFTIEARYTRDDLPAEAMNHYTLHCTIGREGITAARIAGPASDNDDCVVAVELPRDVRALRELASAFTMIADTQDALSRKH